MPALNSSGRFAHRSTIAFRSASMVTCSESTAAPAAAQVSECAFSTAFFALTRGIIIRVSGVRVPPPLLGHLPGWPRPPQMTRFPARNDSCGIFFATQCAPVRAFASPVYPQFRLLLRNGHRSPLDNACARSSACCPAKRRRRMSGTFVPIPFGNWTGITTAFAYGDA